jgi:hypothetical protein
MALGYSIRIWRGLAVMFKGLLAKFKHKYEPCYGLTTATGNIAASRFYGPPYR